ncbi:hypothetical protein HZB02_01285 [Candidatus Woesearchaeota archaeon]|nr:hypothetical protein [Candidatus Woesearchaeota archaeon]
MTHVVDLYAEELADVYAQVTLYHYLKEARPNVELRVVGSGTNNERSREVLEGIPQQVEGKADLTILCLSDITDSAQGKKVLSIDIALLKNSQLPYTLDAKEQLRKQYGVPSNRPVVTIGYPYQSHDLDLLIAQIAPVAEVYVMDTYYGSLSPELQDHVHILTKRGILKDYFAMADAAVWGCNLMESGSALHNFVEATEGGTLFLIQPSHDGKQYGFKALKRRGVIRAFERTKELRDAL